MDGKGQMPADHQDSAAYASTSPLVSVLVSAYDHERFVAHCLDSVLEDGYPNLEILIIDDGSTDASPEVIDAWVAAHRDRASIRFLARANHGLTRTLNELIAMASGVFAVPLGSDDRLLPGGIRARVDALAQDPRAQAVFGDCVVIDDEGRQTNASTLFGYRRANRRWLRDRLAEELITNWAAGGPMILFRLEAIRAIGSYDERLLVEDWNLYLRLVSRGWLRYLDVPVGAYRLHGTNWHRDPGVRARHAEEARTVAVEAMAWFAGRNRTALYLQALAFSRPFNALQRGRLLHLPGRVVRLGIRVVARLIVSLGPPSRPHATGLEEGA